MGCHVPEEPCSRWLPLEAFLWETRSVSLKLTLGDSHTWLCHVKWWLSHTSPSTTFICGYKMKRALLKIAGTEECFYSLCTASIIPLSGFAIIFNWNRQISQAMCSWLLVMLGVGTWLSVLLNYQISSWSVFCRAYWGLSQTIPHLGRCSNLARRCLIAERGLFRKDLDTASKKTLLQRSQHQVKWVGFISSDFLPFSWSPKAPAWSVGRNRSLQDFTYLSHMLQVFIKMGWITFLELSVPLYWL